MLLQTLYKIEVLEIIRSFVVESAKYYGADSKECFDISLSCEEAATHIIQNYPTDREDIFEISCHFENQTFKVILNNTGIPVDKENIPRYDIKNPNDSIEGLKFFLIKKLMDNFYFKNRGNLGWQSVLEKRLLNAKVIEDKTPDKKSAKRDKLSISTATAQDSYEITKLAYETYAYSYAKSIFYYPELLSEAILNEEIISHIAKNEQGEIVAHLGLMRSSTSLEMVESGMMMVTPNYRKSVAILRLLKFQYKILMDKVYRFKIYYANLVTSHIGSQRIVVSFGPKPMALKLSVHPHSQMIEQSTKSTQRESHLYALAFVEDTKEPLTLHISKRHHNIIKRLFEPHSVELILFDESTDKREIETILSVKSYKNELFAIISVKSVGRDIYHKLKRAIKELLAQEYKTIHVEVATHSLIPHGLEDDLNRLGLFFSGIIASSPQKWYTLYTLLEHQVFDFDNIALHTDSSKELMSYLKQERKRVEEI
jgi:anti-sigma regulatory factor (Ser/Thr protein kinase)